jgi:P-type E1-E2 ATPase
LSIGDILITSLDIITIAVPPALPIILTVGISLAMSRLERQSIFCIDPERINYAGRADVMCFDKVIGYC